MQSLRAALKHGDLGDCVGNSGRIFSSRKPDQRLNLVGVNTWQSNAKVVLLRKSLNKMNVLKDNLN